MDVFERAVKTFAQALLACFVGNVTILNADWAQTLAVAGTAALISVLTSLATATFSGTDSPSMVKAPGARLPLHRAGSRRPTDEKID